MCALVGKHCFTKKKKVDSIFVMPMERRQWLYLHQGIFYRYMIVTKEKEVKGKFAGCGRVGYDTCACAFFFLFFYQCWNDERKDTSKLAKLGVGEGGPSKKRRRQLKVLYLFS
jgi:hypothetical protein